MPTANYGKLAAASLRNPSDLQGAARLLYRNGHFPPALALTVIADEELAKSILFVVANTEPSLLPGLGRVLRNHRDKQAPVAWVVRFADSAPLGVESRQAKRIETPSVPGCHVVIEVPRPQGPRNEVAS